MEAGRATHPKRASGAKHERRFFARAYSVRSGVIGHSLPMKLSILSTVSFAALGSVCLAGSTPSHPINAPAMPSSTFLDEELQFDIFGVYGVGHAPDHAGPFREHAWGGGVGMNYFWTKNLGVGIDGDLKRGVQNRVSGVGRRNFEQFTGSLIFRLPLEEYALAPYGFLGGGVTTDVGTLASAHAGIGVEYRLVPNQIGLFTDTRWTYYGDRNSRGDQNNFQIRTGVRFLF